jgi:hypothetical protein
VEQLRVIDASVMPTMTSANTNAAALMIDERGGSTDDAAGLSAAWVLRRLDGFLYVNGY